jgi:hypothetical protein
MTIYDKITKIYPGLKPWDFIMPVGTIRLQNDLDGRGDYIASWTHPDYPQPTDEQLAGIE